MSPESARASRDHVIALLALLPGRLGAGWPAPDSNWPDVPAWRAAEELAVTLRIGVRELTFFHSVEPQRNERLVVECRCGGVPPSSKTECYRKLLTLNHQNFTRHSCVYALDATTRTVVYSTSYLLDSLDIDKLVAAVFDAVQQIMSLHGEFASAAEAAPATVDSTLLLEV